ncbi:MAG: M10 family metallopeptidase C-terminal domain-containing protein, partial [Sphingomicrobium sp.]
QRMYGADMTTRTGNTTYGFHSTADKAVFDFTQNTHPLLTIWDAGGKDTLDLSGFNSNSIIDLNEGAFSSAGYKVTDAVKAADMAYFGMTTETQWQTFLAKYAINADGSPRDNIAIAYGAKIENAVGGSGNDTIKGNALDNQLFGNAGDDILIGGAGKDELTGGAGKDTFVFSDLSEDKIRDFSTGNDKIDLKAFHIGADAIKISGSNVFADTDHNGTYDLHIVVQGDTVHMSDFIFA